MIVRHNFPVKAEFLIPLAAQQQARKHLLGREKGVATIFDDLQT